MCHFWNTNSEKYQFLVLSVSLYFPVTISHIPIVWEGVVLNTRVVGETKACTVSAPSMTQKHMSVFEDQGSLNLRC